jgi:hypothetical protein
MSKNKTINLTLGSLIAGTSAHGAIQHFTTPITSDSSTAGTVSWDVDGLGDAEFELENRTSYSSSLRTTYSIKDLNRGTGGGFGFVRYSPGDPKFKTLTTADSVGATIQSFINLDRNVMFSGIATNGLSSGTQYIGFFFDNNGTNNFGWARVTLTNGGTFGTFTIDEWAYEDTGANIRVGDTVSAIPEPEAAAIGLGALALGAAGLRRMRKRKNAA